MTNNWLTPATALCGHPLVRSAAHLFQAEPRAQFVEHDGTAHLLPIRHSPPIRDVFESFIFTDLK